MDKFSLTVIARGIETREGKVFGWIGRFKSSLKMYFKYEYEYELKYESSIFLIVGI